ncbi:MAG: class II fumarate hydratase [Spirochaetales bacterium]|nr:class II fumarate hydratase [Spirochaetales bacterium]
MSGDVRVESDSMGEISLSADSLWGAQTQRAVENFAVSDLRIHPYMLKALCLIKKHAALANSSLGLLDEKLAAAVASGADRIVRENKSDQFPIDVFQTGSGTSWNMNINEVLSNLANLELGGTVGSRTPVHPNDHVNKGQSSNDVIPSAITLANRLLLHKTIDHMKSLELSFSKKAGAFQDILKLGRTHLQDAVPMTLGQEFSAFAAQIRQGRINLESMKAPLSELPLGGTAIGTGLNAHPDFAVKAVEGISEETGITFRVMENKFQGISFRSAQVDLMGVINSISSDLMKIANDLRLLTSGPRSGLGEIILPSLQPGSSIMPGKVNPVIPEMVIQVAAHLQGKALSVSIANQHGPLQLNMMMPLISHETLSALELLAETARVFALNCIDGIEAEKENCLQAIEGSLAMVTPVALTIGYDEAARIAYKAYKEKRPVRQVLYESGLLSREEVDRLLDPSGMTGEQI